MADSLCAAITLFPGTWAKDAIAYLEHCERPNPKRSQNSDRPLCPKQDQAIESWLSQELPLCDRFSSYSKEMKLGFIHTQSQFSSGMDIGR
jgi:hypothetical protein